MRIFTLLCALALGGIGASSYYGWEARGGAGPVLTAAIPAFVGGTMLLGVIVALLLRRTGLQIAFLAALLGAGLAVGRMVPDYLKEIFEPRDRFTTLMLAMGGVCLLYVLISVMKFVFRKRPVRRGKKGKMTAGDKTDGEEVVAAAGGGGNVIVP